MHPWRRREQIYLIYVALPFIVSYLLCLRERGGREREEVFAHNTCVSDVLKNRNISTEGVIWVEA